MDKTVAILSRTNRALMIFEQALSEAQVKYHLVGRSGFWSQTEVKSVLAYLGCVLYPADWLVAGAIRSPFFPSQYLPKTKLLAALKEPQNPGDATMLSYWAALTTCPERLVEPKNLGSLRDFVSFIHSLSRYRDLSAQDGLRKVIEALKVVEFYHGEESSPDNNPLGNLSELLKLSGRHGSIKDFLDYCRRASAASKSKKGVGLSTIHGFKGAEADVIYIVGCQEGLIPHAKSTDLDEEKNIFFVAASRPRHKLVITYSGQPSPFLAKQLSKPVV